MSINTFQEILAWQKSHKLVLKVYELTKDFPAHEKFSLVSQINRAAVSIPSNIAEGYRRNSKKDSLHFYNISQASLEELRYQLILSKDLNYISESQYKDVFVIAEEASKVLNGWVKNCKSY